MIVYHYIDDQYGIENLKNRHLKVSRILELNDPFEFLGVNTQDRIFRRALKSFKAQLSKRKGLLCFSKTWKNPLMWSHYANKHKGICLGFEVHNSIINKVKYKNTRFKIPQYLDEAFMKKLLFTKFRHWKYEQEYRVYVQLEQHTNDICFQNYSEEIKLRTVIVGANSDFRRADIQHAIGANSTNIDVFKARTAFSEFKVTKQRNTALWL